MCFGMMRRLGGEVGRCFWGGGGRDWCFRTRMVQVVLGVLSCYPCTVVRHTPRYLADTDIPSCQARGVV